MSPTSSQINHETWPGGYECAVSLTYDDGNDTHRGRVWVATVAEVATHLRDDIRAGM